MNKEKFLQELDFNLKDYISDEQRNKILDDYSSCIKDDERIGKKNPKLIATSIILLNALSDKKRHSITSGMPILFSTLRLYKGFLNNLINVFFILLSFTLFLGFIFASSIAIIAAIKTFNQISYLELGLSIAMLSFSTTFLSLAIFFISFAFSSLRHIPYLGLYLLRKKNV